MRPRDEPVMEQPDGKYVVPAQRPSSAAGGRLNMRVEVYDQKIGIGA